MEKILKTLKVDFYKAILSMAFLIGVIGVFSVYLLVAKPELNQYTDIIYIFRMSIEWIGTYHLMILLMCTLPFSTIFCKEWSSKNINYNIIRSNVRIYSWSKFLVCSIVGGLVVFIGTTLFIAIMSRFFPIINSFRIEDNSFAYTMANELLVQGNVFGYISIYLLLRFLYGAFWASVGLLCSSYIPNIFVALSSPFILSYVYRIIAYKLPLYFRLEHIANGSMGDFINNNFIHTLIYSIVIFIILIAISGVLFEKNVRWRIENE